MVVPNRVAAWQSMCELLSCGRTSSEQIEAIRKYGNHGASPVLRASVLAAIGIPRPKEKASNCIIFGCYRPFTTPFFLRDCIRLMDLLSIDYTYLNQEYCCGFPLAMTASKDELGDALSTGREFNQLNLDLARQTGADRLVYCCVGCVHAAQSTLSDASGRHVYIVDLILDSIENRPLEMPPTVVGYYEGCHFFAHSIYPNAGLDWSRYRQRLGEIKGLEIVDLPNRVCCKESTAEIVATARKMEVTKIVCPCSGCYSSLVKEARGGMELTNVPELLLQSLEHTVLLQAG